MNDRSDQESYFSFLRTREAQDRKSLRMALAVWGWVIACTSALGFLGWLYRDHLTGDVPRRAVAHAAVPADAQMPVQGHAPSGDGATSGPRKTASARYAPKNVSQSSSATREDEALRHQVERDIAAHLEIQRHGLRVEIVQVENGYVTLGLLNGPAGLALELTGSEWAEEALPGFTQEFLLVGAGFQLQPNLMVELLTASQADSERSSRVCANLAVAIKRNPTCKGVYWTEVPAARARRLFAESSVLFFSNGTPFGQELRDAYRKWQEKGKGLDRFAFPPGILGFLRENSAGNTKGGDAAHALIERLRPVWGKPAHALGWMTLLQVDRKDAPIWFRAYREAWETPEFWQHVRESDPTIPEDMVKCWGEVETAIRAGRLEELLGEFDLGTFDLDATDGDEDSVLTEPDMFVSVTLPLLSLALALEASKDEQAVLWTIAKMFSDARTAAKRRTEILTFSTRGPFYAPGDRFGRKGHEEENTPFVPLRFVLWGESASPGQVHGYLIWSLPSGQNPPHGLERLMTSSELYVLAGTCDAATGTYVLTRDDTGLYRALAERQRSPVEKVELRPIAGKRYRLVLFRGTDRTEIEVERQ